MLDEEAVATARALVDGVLEVDPDGEVTVERADGVVVVTFVHAGQPGERGPDFDAKVTLDEATGELVEILGS